MNRGGLCKEAYTCCLFHPDSSCTIPCGICCCNELYHSRCYCVMRNFSWIVVVSDVLLPEFSSSSGGVCCELQCNYENSDVVVWGCVLFVGRCLIFLSFGPCHCLDRSLFWTFGLFQHLDLQPLDFCTLVILSSM